MSKSSKELNHLTVQQGPGESADIALARSSLRPTVQAALTLRNYSKGFGEFEMMALIESLTEQTQAVIGGDLGRGEAMLTAQAHTLDAIYNNLARRAITADYMDPLETYLKLALRAQSQCRATWETVSAIKHPPMMGYVKQANIAHGHQQVNNIGEKVDNVPTKLLDEQNGERLDTGATCTTGRVDKDLETVDTVNGS